MSQIKVECPHCGYAGQMDGGLIPAGGVRVRCPKCREPFTLRAPTPASANLAAAVPAAVPATREAPAATPPPPVAPPPARPSPAPADRSASGTAEPSAPGKSGKDLRKFKRIPFAFDVLVNRATLMKAIDLSEGGLYVHTGRSFSPGSVIEVELPLGERKLTVKGSVQHNQVGVGVGVKFVDLSEGQLGAIREYLHSAAAVALSAGPTRKKILLVDEDPMKRRMSKSKLVLEGYSVVDFEDAAEAIRTVEQEAPDLVILDPVMVKMDGFKALAIIKGFPKLKDVPVLIYSSKGSDEIVRKALASGASEYLLKMTTTPAKLAEIVKRILPVRGQ